MMRVVPAHVNDVAAGRVKLSSTDLESDVVECNLLAEPPRQPRAETTVPSASLGGPSGHGHASLEGTGPARPGGARCTVEAVATREPQHPSIGRSPIAAPVKRDDPPTAVAAAFLDPRRCRLRPASTTERIHAGTTTRPSASTSIQRPSSLSEASTTSTKVGQPAPLIDFSRTPSPPLRPAVSDRSVESQRRTAQRWRTDQKRKPRTR